MGNSTVEKAIALRDTISPPTLIINNLLQKEGMKEYESVVCGRVLELLDEHLEYVDDIIYDFMDHCNIKVTVVGFFLIKHIMLSYISEESFDKYMKFIRLNTEFVKSCNSNNCA